MTNTSNDETYEAWIGHAVVDHAQEKVGKVSAIYLDDQTGNPDWLAVNTGMFKSKASFVPMDGVTADGDKLVIPFDKDKVKGAPQVEEDGDGYLSPEEEQTLYTYYGRDYNASAPETETQSAAIGTESAGHDTSGPNTDTAMTRSEEEIRVGTQTRESGRARLRKYVVTENVTQTVPVSHEEVRVEREPITDANRDAAISGADITEEEHEVTLHEEVPVVQKEVVAKERVRLGTETVTGEETVSDELRKERIDTEGLDTEKNPRT